MNQQNPTSDAESRQRKIDTNAFEIDHALFPYLDQGQGEPVVLLHGALTDHRMWKRHIDAISDRFRAIAYTQRYFGVLPWSSDWPPFGINTHSADLVQFLKKLAAGPVHLVAWSYAGHAALNAALTHPQLFRSLFIYEPGFPTYVTDPNELNAVNTDASAMYGPIFEAILENKDNVKGVRRLIDASGQKEGYFASQSRDRQEIEFDNARTMPLLLSQSAPPLITCEQLSVLPMPICIAQGEQSRPVFNIVSRAAARCIPGCRHRVIPGVNHMWPDEDPEGFTKEFIDFIHSA